MKRRIMASFAAAVLGLAGGLAAVLASPASPAQAATNYWFAKAQDSTNAPGYMVSATVANPYIDTVNDYHTNIDVAMDDAAGNSIEVGWMKDLAMFGNNRPHLFAFNRNAGVSGCYNGCGLVDDTTNPINAGADLLSYTGTVHTFGAYHDSANSRWNLQLDSTTFAWYPDSYFSTTGFTTADRGIVFGEVASPRLVPCTDMGTGYYGANGSAAAFSNWKQWSGSAWVAGSLNTPTATDSTVYDFANASATGFTYGGPGFSSIGEVTDNATGSCAPSTAGTPNNTLVLWGQECPDGNGSTGCTNKYNTAASCSPAPCSISGALGGVTYTTWQNISTSGKSFSVGRTAACTGTQLTLAPNGSGTAKGKLPAGWDAQNIKCVRRIA